MIRTEQLSADTITFHVRGLFDQSTAKELALSVFRSHHLGFKTFLCDLSQALLLDDLGSRHLEEIRQGLESKGGTWRVLGYPHLPGNSFLLGTNLESFPQATWN